jgi:hypothetical protein
LQYDCARVFCPACKKPAKRVAASAEVEKDGGKDSLVARSCKSRGFCPSCRARRMADTAVWLVDRVLPDASAPGSSIPAVTVIRSPRSR